MTDALSEVRSLVRLDLGRHVHPGKPVLCRDGMLLQDSNGAFFGWITNWNRAERRRRGCRFKAFDESVAALVRLKIVDEVSADEFYELTGQP